MKRPVAFGAFFRRNWARIGGYGAFFLACFLLFAYWSFPYDSLRDHIVREVEYPQGPAGRRASGWELEIADLSPSWLTGVTATGVRIAKRPTNPEDAAIDQRIDELTLRVSPLSLLVGKLNVSFDADVAGGEVDGDYANSDEAVSVDANVDDVKLDQLPIIRRYLGIPMSGTAKGTIAMTVSQDPQQTEGHVDLTVGGLAVGNGKAKLKLGNMQEGLTIERIDAGDLKLTATAEKGVAKIDELHAKGKDAELNGSGTMRLLRPLDMSRIDTLMRIKFAESYRNENDRTRALFSIMEFNPRVREARTPDGAMQWRIAGSFGGQLLFSPAGKASRSR